MEEQFEKRLQMHRIARKPDEGTRPNRLLLQLCNEQDLLGRPVQASMHKKLAMEQQIGRQLTAKDPTYQRLLDKAADEQIEQEAARLAQLASAKKGKQKGVSLGDGAGEDGDDAATGEQPERRRSSRESKRPEREGQIWLEVWSSGVETEKQPLQPPSADLFLEVIESVMISGDEWRRRSNASI
jgi:hypothetical protein